MTTTQPPDDIEPEGTPNSVPTKTPDAELKLTDAGIEMPEFLKGYCGSFTMRTPTVTGEFETSDSGLPKTRFWDGLIAVMPEDGDWHGDLEAGMIGISTPEHRETVYQIVDQRGSKEDDK